MSLSIDGSCNILGIDVFVTNARALTQRIDDASKSATPLRLAFLNQNLANLAVKNRDLTRVLKHFLVVNDGIGISIAARLLYRNTFPENLNGTDYIPYFLTGTVRNLRIFLLGSRVEVVARAAEVLEQRWPRHKVVGYHHGFYAEGSDDELVARIKAAAPDIILVGMGNPLQERWILKHVPEACAQAFAVGAWFDFLAGEFPRAPTWIRKMGFEWLFRFALEPRRLFNRYAMGIPMFLGRVLRQRFVLLSSHIHLERL